MTRGAQFPKSTIFLPNNPWGLQFCTVCFPPYLDSLGTNDITFVFLLFVLDGLFLTNLHGKGCNIKELLWWFDDLDQF